MEGIPQGKKNLPSKSIARRPAKGKRWQEKAKLARGGSKKRKNRRKGKDVRSMKGGEACTGRLEGGEGKYSYIMEGRSGCKRKTRVGGGGGVSCRRTILKGRNPDQKEENATEEKEPAPPLGLNSALEKKKAPPKEESSHRVTKS